MARRPDPTASERQRRWRERRRNGAVPVHGEVPFSLALALSEHGVIPEGAEADPARLFSAVVETLDRLLAERDDGLPVTPLRGSGK